MFLKNTVAAFWASCLGLVPGGCLSSTTPHQSPEDDGTRATNALGQFHSPLTVAGPCGLLTHFAWSPASVDLFRRV